MLLKLKIITLISCWLMISTSATANEGGKSNKELNVTVIGSGKVQIETLATDQTATYEIEKSYDNKKFSKVAVLLPNDAISSEKAILFKDNVKLNKKKVYYRLKIINNKGTNITATNMVTL